MSYTCMHLHKLTHKHARITKHLLAHLQKTHKHTQTPVTHLQGTYTCSCMHTFCKYIYIRIHIYAHIYKHMHTHTGTQTHTQTVIIVRHTHECTHVNKLMYLNNNRNLTPVICSNALSHIQSTIIYAHIHTHTHTYTHTYIHIIVRTIVFML